jgi:hypothetical protein
MRYLRPKRLTHAFDLLRFPRWEGAFNPAHRLTLREAV